MRKIVLAMILTFGLFGCDTKEYYTVLVTNGSSKAVSYTYNEYSDTLAVQESKIYEVKAYTQPPKNITDQNGIASLKIKTNSMTGNYIFLDVTPLDLNVINRLPIDITIKADNYIDNNGSIELTIGSNDESTGAKIYIKSPIFTSTTNYPIIVEYTIVENVMSVIIM